MNPSEILEELRDIHLPRIAEKSEPLEFDPRPFAVFAAIVLVVALVRYLRRTRWQRQARARMAEISGIEDPDRAAEALIGLLKAVPARTRLSALPEGIFQPAGNTTPDDVEKLSAQVHTVLQGRHA